MFQLSTREFEDWKSQFATSNSNRMGLRKKPYAFTESGIAMLSSVLRSDIAVQVNIRIIKRLETIEYHQLEMKRRQDQTENRIDEIFDKINQSDFPTQGIFYNGQI